MVESIARRRRMSSVPNNRLGSVVARLRRRDGLSQTQLARLAGISSSSTISRLESGDSGRVSADLVGKLSDVLDATGELWAAAGSIRAEAVEYLAAFWHAYDSENLFEKTTPAVRRVHHSALAQELLNDAPGALRGSRVDLDRLAAALKPAHRIRRLVGAAPGVRLEDNTIVLIRRPPSTVDGAGLDLTERDEVLGRFLAAHAVAHIRLGSRECRWPHNDRDEASTDDLATQLLLPPLALVNAFRRAVRGTPADMCADGWSPDTNDLIDQIGRSTGAPAWVVVRRLAEDDLLQEHSQEASL